MILNDEYYMKLALKEAQKAHDAGEIPVGAVIVSNHQILAKTHNQTEQLKDVSAHAELLAITAASHALNSKYLNECTLYVTLEPCVMCAGALYWSQIGRIVFGAYDEKRGCMRFNESLLHPKTQVVPGILDASCSTLLKSFFAKRR